MRLTRSARSPHPQALARLRTVGLDKTGTLTTGHFDLLQLRPLPGAGEHDHSRAALHRLVAAVEEGDNHPLARSLVASYKGCIADFVASGEVLPPAEGFSRHGRDAVSATVEGRRVAIGNEKFLRATLGSLSRQLGGGGGGGGEGGGGGGGGGQLPMLEDVDDADMPPRLRAALRKKREKERLAAAEANGADGGDGDGGAPTAAEAAAAASLRAALEVAAAWEESGSVLFVLVDGVATAALLLDDTVKPEAAATVAALRALGVRPLMLTGDRISAARRVARAGASSLAWSSPARPPASAPRVSPRDPAPGPAPRPRPPPAHPAGPSDPSPSRLTP